MQIQDKQRSAKPQADSRTSPNARFSPYGRVEAGNAEDLFAQIFQEIAAIQSPSGPAKEEPATAPQESHKEAASRSQGDESAAPVKEDDAVDDREVDDATVIGLLPVSPLPVTDEPVAEQVLESDEAESAITLATVSDDHSGVSKQKSGGEPSEAVMGSEPRAVEVETAALTKPVESDDLTAAQVTGHESQSPLQTGETDANAAGLSQSADRLSDATERFSTDEQSHALVNGEGALSAQAPAAQPTSDPSSRDRRDRRGRAREGEARVGAVRPSGAVDVRADVSAATETSKPDIAQASGSASSSSMKAELAASNLSAPGLGAVATPLVAPEAVTSGGWAGASAAAGTGTRGNSGAADSSGAGDSSRVTSAALGGVVQSGSDTGEVASNHVKPMEARGDVADRARLVHRIAKAFQRMGVDGGQVRLRMHPDDLGSVQLDMQISGRKVSATVTADNEDARLLLQSSLPELRQRLESQGLTVERLEVEKRAEEENRGFSSREHSHQQSGYEQSSGGRDDLWGRSTLARANSVAANRGNYGLETALQRTPAPLAIPGGVPVDRSLDLQL